MAFKMTGPWLKSALKQTTGETKPDWSKAPAVGTTERTLWYQKHKLKLDETTPKISEFPVYVGEWQEGSYMPDWEGGGSDPIPHSKLHKYKGN